MTSRNIFVFGSNLAGRHGAGAAKWARNHEGAVYGQGWGLQGTSFAIPTKDEELKPLPLPRIEAYVRAFIAFTRLHPELSFKVTRIGCGLAGYSDGEIAPMFRNAPSNCLFDPNWSAYLEEESAGSDRDDNDSEDDADRASGDGTAVE